MYLSPLLQKEHFQQIFVPPSWFQFKRKDTLKYRTPHCLLRPAAMEKVHLHLCNYLIHCICTHIFFSAISNSRVLVKWKEQSHIAFLLRKTRQRVEAHLWKLHTNTTPGSTKAQSSLVSKLHFKSIPCSHPCFWRKMLIEKEVVQPHPYSLLSPSNGLIQVSSPSSILICTQWKPLGAKTCCNSIEYKCNLDIPIKIQPLLRYWIIAALFKPSGSRFSPLFFCRYWNL